MVYGQKYREGKELFREKNNPVGTVADGQQLVLHIIRQNVLTLHDTMYSVFLAQFAKHCFRDASLCRYFCFDDSAMRFSNGGEFRHVIHALTSATIIP